MVSLPSFVELMASLGLERPTQATTAGRSPSPRPRSPVVGIVGCKNVHTRSSSSPSPREVAEVATRHHISRYSPYSSLSLTSRRRGSLSSVSSSSDFEASPLSATFSIPSRPRAQKTRNKCLTVNVYDSLSDLAANTPISTYVRRKTPGTSPSSLTFDHDSGYESSSSVVIPFSIPSLPVLLPNSSNLASTPTSDSLVERTSPKSGVKRFCKSKNRNRRIVRRSTGVGISVPSTSVNDICAGDPTRTK